MGILKLAKSRDSLAGEDFVYYKNAIPAKAAIQPQSG
jgi:hypothetical protein